MGIYISNIEMPKGADEYRLIIRANGQVIIDKKTYWEEAQAISVPPHGRLGDLDALIEKCEEIADKEDGNQLDALVLLKWFLEQNVPTIVPAEPKKPREIKWREWNYLLPEEGE